jgi:hypothetical protein
MSQPSSRLDIKLPDGWTAVAEPTAGASLQAFAPVDDGFRSSIVIYAYAPAQETDGPPSIDALHRAQIDDMLSSLTGAQELEDSPTIAADMNGRVAVVGFRQDEYTILARVWTLQAANVVFSVAGLCDAARVTEIGPQINAAVESLVRAG